ncbi:hypothetical protein BJX64DRAFT_274788 [Aspergillus heterothallicus]
MSADEYPVRPEFSIAEDEITGYVNPWVLSPGDTADISSTKPNLKYQLVRLLQGLDWPGAPKPQREVIEHGPSGEVKGRFQAAHPGSYGLVEAWARESPLQNIDGLEVSFYVQPWMLDAPYPQAIVSTLDADNGAGITVLVGTKNDLVIWFGTTSGVETVRVDLEVRRQRWFHIRLTIRERNVQVHITNIPWDNEITPPPVTSQTTLRDDAVLDSTRPLLISASYAANPSTSSKRPVHFFNGRIDALVFKSVGQRPWDIARYDFSIGIDTDEITDVSGSNLHGILINAPTRAVRGHDYNHKLIGVGWKQATYGFGAIHFHEDDLDDAAWETAVLVPLPADLRPGAYAIEVRDAGSELKDSIVFFVRPKTRIPTAKSAFVFSTMTYLAYANEHMYDESKTTHISFPEGVQLLESDNYHKMLRRSDLGLAIYDLHSDGSGVVYSTSKRPILNMRPDYVHWGFQRPREFAADLIMVGFLERVLGTDGYDVLTDHELHMKGQAALQGYDVVITGSHPEYPSMEILDAYQGFVERGGSILYTGGNGFYWRSVTNPKRPHRMEVRRADVGAGTHELPSGERVHSLSGQLGGLWRSLGRPPNILFGIGSCASGKGPGRSFIPTQEALDNPSLAWLWKGIDESSQKLLGTKGLAGGASGDELDRLDVTVGSPESAVLLARKLIFPMIGTLGSTSELVRSDMVYYETSGGGAVFTVGSINWNNSLAWDEYQNDISVVTKNVLREFLARGEKLRQG